jgi:hypothetical protein
MPATFVLLAFVLLENDAGKFGGAVFYRIQSGAIGTDAMWYG